MAEKAGSSPFVTSTATATAKNTSTTVKTYRVEAHSWSKPTLEVFDTATNTLVYTADSHTFRPHIVVQSPSQPGVTISEATFPSFSSRVEITYQGRTIVLEKTGFFRGRHAFTSISGEPLTWKGGVSSLVCLDQKEQKVASIQTDGWSGRTKSLDIVSDVGEEVLISALVMFLYERRKSRSRSGAAGAAGSAGAAAGGGAGGC
ncbi:hypothetical protein ANO11243_000480 [Dothideomycetidae sp. 11243]|nr:hypothetical protein ANO11243_000480 [fungal sp. No.11243]